MQLEIIKNKYLEDIKSLLNKCELKLYEINIINDYDSIILQVLVENLDTTKKNIEFDFLIKANEQISMFLDTISELKDPYILEVSSAGAERVVKEEEILKNNINEYFHLETYKTIENVGEFSATLLEHKGDEFTFSFFIKGKPKKVGLK